MIRYVHGTLVTVEEGLITIEAGGLGYGIRVPMSVLSALPPVGSELTIHTYFSVREDALELFGFMSPEDRSMFVKLLTVSGVGPKGALGMLSVLNPDQLRFAIASGDVKAIQSAPGIGKKTAERVILELKDKMPSLGALAGKQGAELPAGAGIGADGLHTAAQEAMEALTALGYSASEARGAVSKVDVTDGMTADDVLKQSLRHLAF